MAVQSRMIEGTDAKAPREPPGLVLLKEAESKLRQGHICEAVKLFRAIVNRYPVSLERLAALSYLRTRAPDVRVAARPVQTGSMSVFEKSDPVNSSGWP